jgi:hypothetical protein
MAIVEVAMVIVAVATVFAAMVTCTEVMDTTAVIAPDSRFTDKRNPPEFKPAGRGLNVYEIARQRIALACRPTRQNPLREVGKQSARMGLVFSTSS